MKRYILGLAIALLIATPVYAYKTQAGDTPYGLWGSAWRSMLDVFGIKDQYSLPVGLEIDATEVLGATPTPTSSASIKYVESPDFFLYTPAVAGDTSVVINDLKDIYGNTLTMDDFGSLGYGRIDPDGASVSESFTFSGVTANSDGTYSLTGVKTVLAKYPYTQTSGLVRSHSINAIVRFTNTASFYDNFANKENDEIVDGLWTFNYNNLKIGDGTTTGDKTLTFNDGTSAFIRKNVTTGKLQWSEDGTNFYNFTSSTVSTLTAGDGIDINAGAIDLDIRSGRAVTTTSGELDILTQDATGISQDASGLKVVTSTLVSLIATSTPTANSISMSNASGTLDAGWISYISLFGNGQDGDVTISTNTSLSRDMYYDDLTVNTGVVLNPNGFRIYVKGTLDTQGTGKIAVNGGNGGNGNTGNNTPTDTVGGTAGAGAYSSGTLPLPRAGTAGGAGSSSGPTVGVAGTNVAKGIINSNGSQGGKGGDAYTTGGAGGTAGTVTSQPLMMPYSVFTSLLLNDLVGGTLTPHTITGQSTGGGTGATNQTSVNLRPGSGGGSGASGGMIWLFAKNIITANIEAYGGNGGNGGNGYNGSGDLDASGGGGGAGGNGGLIILNYSSAITINTNVSGGTGGTGGTSGGGVGTNAGANGTSGAVGLVINLHS